MGYNPLQVCQNRQTFLMGKITKKKLFSFALPFIFLFELSHPTGLISPLPANYSPTQEKILAEHILPLNDRIESPTANEIFKENILLNIQYFGQEINLEPGETFAFHDQLLPEYQSRAVKTGFTHFTSSEGFKAVGGLRGNGICHLASLMNWTAQKAGLEVFAPSRHDFFPINDIPKEYGTSIYYYPSGGWRTLNQNLYITNNFNHPVKFVFEVNGDLIKLKIIR